MIKVAEKFMNMMKLNDSDNEEDFEEGFEEAGEEEFFEEEYEETEPETPEEEEEAPAPKKPLFSFKRKEKEAESEVEEPVYEEARVVPFVSGTEEGDIVKVIKPQEFNEAQIVAELLKEGKTIVVNLEGIEINQAQRIIDFIGGASFAVDGTLKAISNNIFIVAPGNIEVSGDLREEIINENMLSPELSKF